MAEIAEGPALIFLSEDHYYKIFNKTLFYTAFLKLSFIYRVFLIP